MKNMEMNEFFFFEILFSNVGTCTVKTTVRYRIDFMQAMHVPPKFIR